MALEYFPCYHSYLNKLRRLSDQEVGRLFRACLVYSSTGERQELAGRESMAFDFIADDIDRAKEAYRAKSEINRQNRVGTTDNDRDDRQRSITTDNDRDKTNTNTKSKTKRKPKESNTLPYSPLSGLDAERIEKLKRLEAERNAGESEEEEC